MKSKNVKIHIKETFSKARDHDRRAGTKRETSPRPELSPIGDIPYLQLRGKNFAAWEDKLYSYSVRTFGEISRTIKTRAAYVPPLVAPPDGMPAIEGNAEAREVAIHHPLRAAYNQEIQERVKHIREMEKMKPRLYGVIWDTLSLESQEKVEQTTDFATGVANVFDVVQLGNLICHVPEARLLIVNSDMDCLRRISSSRRRFNCT